VLICYEMMQNLFPEKLVLLTKYVENVNLVNVQIFFAYYF